MCTAISINGERHFFGRNLDWEHSFGENLIITPGGFNNQGSGFAIIGMGIVREGYPLYFDGFNEKGIAAAGLNFPEAVYSKRMAWKENIPSYEVIFKILSECASLEDVKKLLENANITDEAFSDEFRPSPLHWIIADEHKSLVAEQTKYGLKLYDNPCGVLANSPPFPYHMYKTAEYMNLSAKEGTSLFLPGVSLKAYSRGMSLTGLPGDYSSSSRFVRAAFLRNNCVIGAEKSNPVADFLRIMGSLVIPEGAVLSEKGCERTVYTSCCDIYNKTYYYTVAGSLKIRKAVLTREYALGSKLVITEGEGI